MTNTDEVTLESLARRVAALERQISRQSVVPPTRDWRSVIGMSADTPIVREVHAAIAEAREQERREAREEAGE